MNLCIRLDPSLTFWAEKQYGVTKAAKVTSLLGGLMANIGCPKQSRRRLKVAIADSILLYGSEVWADVLRLTVE